MTYILEAQDLRKSFRDVVALNGISFGIEQGTCFGLLGPNGAGKTTTVEILENITRADSGHVLYRNNPIGKNFRQEAGIQFQSTSLQEFLTVKETLLLFHGLYDKTMDLDELVEICALGDFLHRDNQRLSGGQKQRLLLALALINDPEILFLDEPTTGLDPQARRNFWHLIENIKNRNKTIVLTTHYMEEASILCDEIIIMDRGNIIAQGSPENLLREHFSDVLLQIPEADFSFDNSQAGLNISRINNHVVIYTDNVHATLHQLGQQNVDLKHLEIRTRNLEDLFLELTGKELRS